MTKKIIHKTCVVGLRFKLLLEYWVLSQVSFLSIYCFWHKCLFQRLDGSIIETWQMDQYIVLILSRCFLHYAESWKVQILVYLTRQGVQFKKQCGSLLARNKMFILVRMGHTSVDTHKTKQSKTIMKKITLWTIPVMENIICSFYCR